MKELNQRRDPIHRIHDSSTYVSNNTSYSPILNNMIIEQELLLTLEQSMQIGRWKAYESYKDSGIEWLGEIPRHWSKAMLKRYLISLKDGTHGTFQRVTEGIPLLSAKNVNDGKLQITDCESLISEADHDSINRNGYLKVGDLLLTIVGTIGRTAIFDYPEPVAFQRSVAVLRFQNKYHVPYFYYLIQSCYVQSDLLSRVKQSAQSGVYLSDIALLPVIAPPRWEQLAIVTFLDRETAKINDLIAKKERLIELLQEQRTATINQAVTKGLNPKVPMKDSGVEWLGKIPEHWSKAILKRYLISLKDGTHGTFQRVAEGIPLLSAKNVNGGKLQVTDCESLISEADYDLIHRNGYLKVGDLLLTIVGTIGRTAIFNYPEPVAFQRSVAVLRFQAHYHVPYFYYLIQSCYVQSDLLSRVKQSAQSGVYLSDISLLPVIAPPHSEQQAIATFLDQETTKIDKLISVIQEGIKKLKEYSTALVSAAVTGKIDVRGEVADIDISAKNAVY